MMDRSIVTVFVKCHRKSRLFPIFAATSHFFDPMFLRKINPAPLDPLLNTNLDDFIGLSTVGGGGDVGANLRIRS